MISEWYIELVIILGLVLLLLVFCCWAGYKPGRILDPTDPTFPTDPTPTVTKVDLPPTYSTIFPPTYSAVFRQENV